MSIENRGTSSIKHDKLSEITAPQHSLLEYKSSELFQGKNELIIVHAQEQYHLRITRHGKLILTK